MNNNQNVIEIDILELIQVLMSKIVSIILVTVLVGGIGYVYSNFFIDPSYVSTTKIYVLDKNDSSSISYSDLNLSNYLVKDYAQLIQSRTVIENVIDNLHLDYTYEKLLKKVTVSTATDNRILTIQVSDSSPLVAQTIAKEIRKCAAEHIKYVMNSEAVNIVDEANLPVNPSAPSVLKYTVIGALLGCCAICGWIVLNFVMNDSLKSSSDVEKYLELSTLGTIPLAIELDNHPTAQKKKKTTKKGK